MEDIIVLVLGCNSEPYISIEKAIRDTWLKNNANVRVIFFYGNSDRTCLQGDRLYLKAPEGLMNIGYKTLAAYQFIQENFKYKHLFTTNMSSYIDVPLLSEYLKNKPSTKFYSGIVGQHQGITFCSGSGYVLTSDLVDLLLMYADKWDHSYISDVSIGLLLRQLDISITDSATRFDVIDSSMVIPASYYHYRLKSSVGDRTDDIIRMHLIHKLKYDNN